jgi:UDP-N-acetylmuramoyl-L-alanyl-D-glutamate--2,6-diaminopimelate ligase
MADRGVTLSALAEAVGGSLAGPKDLLIDDVDHDSRRAGPGVMFVALRGDRHDGHDFVEAARSAGSPAVCVENAAVAGGVPHILVEDTRRALPILADSVHGHPSHRFTVVGVTGTNGKTTVTHMVEAIGRAAGMRTALIGTVGGRIGDEAVPLERTTPEASDLQRLFARMVTASVDLAAVEVSSHGIALCRSAATRFAVVAFTNLSQDHLDFHGDMETYFSVKQRLFDQAGRGVVWVDDPWGRRLADGLSIPVTTVGFSGGSDVMGADVRLGFDGSTVSVRGSGVQGSFTIPLAGRFNVANALMAAALAAAVEIDTASIVAGISAVPAIPGRFERVDVGREFTVVVDYAHTPDGVSGAVSTARDILAGTGRVVVVVGAGGDRDRAKRPLIGYAAAQADVAVLTTDNPRSEDPEAILQEVAAGATGPGRVLLEADRRHAIRLALSSAGPGDAVLILGKGHETTQEVAGQVIAFDDREVVREEARDL